MRHKLSIGRIAQAAEQLIGDDARNDDDGGDDEDTDNGGGEHALLRLARAVEDASLQARVVAEGLSMKLGLVRSINAGSQGVQQPSPMPRMMAPPGLTTPQDGVIATRPATAPEAAPSIEGLPLRRFSKNSQDKVAMAVATRVLTKAREAVPLTSRLEPTLKPNQPMQSSQVPSASHGIEEGGNGRPCGP